MSGDSSSSTDTGSSSTSQTLASAFLGGLAGYVDAQHGTPVTFTSLAPQTAYGYAGYGQPVPAAGSASSAALPSWLLPLALIGGLVALLLKKG